VVSAFDFGSEGRWFENHGQFLPSCCFHRQETLPTPPPPPPTLSFSTQVHKMGTSDILLGATLRSTSIPSRVGGWAAILSFASYYCVLFVQVSWRLSCDLRTRSNLLASSLRSPSHKSRLRRQDSRVKSTLSEPARRVLSGLPP